MGRLRVSYCLVVVEQIDFEADREDLSSSPVLFSLSSIFKGRKTS